MKTLKDIHQEKLEMEEKIRVIISEFIASNPALIPSFDISIIETETHVGVHHSVKVNSTITI